MMKRKTWIVVSLVVSLLFILAFVIMLITLGTTDSKYTEENTTEYKATMVKLETKVVASTLGDDSGHCTLYTKEYGDKLSFLYLIGTINIDELNNMKAGETIYFRIENIWVEQFEESPFDSIVSLRTDEIEILTLNSSTKYWEQQIFKIKMTAITFTIIFVLIAVQCILMLNGINIFARRKKTLN